ncbi:MAG: DUF2442 domain-containing protein [Bacteroidota bacterium]
MARHTIIEARPTGDGILYVWFASGEERVFDTRPYQRSAFFHRLGDPAYFCQVRVEAGTVTWPDGHDFDPGTVYARSVRPPGDGGPEADVPMAPAGEA